MIQCRSNNELEDGHDKVEEAYEVVSAIEEGDDENLREELGDLLFTVVNLGRLMNIDPTLTLNGTNQKFIARFHELEKRLKDSGSSVEEATLDTMDALWNRIKSGDNKQTILIPDPDTLRS